MTLEGTVVNGLIVLDGAPALPEGARVRVELSGGGCEAVGEVLEYPHPLAPYDRAKELDLLRRRVADMQSGAPGIPLDEAMTRIRAELNLPHIEPE